MIKSKYIFATSIAVFCAYCGVSQSALMSKYGEIQPVNKYSSNPFWTPDSPYNLRFPSPIYATGPDLNTETCSNTVAALVSSYCSENNNCSKLQVSDVRPKIMIQLSQLPGHNYATSCGGYIDNAVKEYKKNHGNSFSGINIVQQPKTTKPLSLTGVVTSQPKTKSDGVAERTAELEQVQAMTTQTIDVVETDFPKTIADLSFVDRVANATAGYEPYKDLKSYHIPKFETEQEYYSRMESLLKHDINYETYDGKPKSKSPTSYLTGRGAKITWHPERDYSTFKGWCESEDLTLNPADCPKNCPMEPSIDPMSKSDKSFYACWECDSDHTMVRDHYCECPDKDHMDKKTCECLPKNATKFDGKKCVCNNGHDIDTKCQCPDKHMTMDSGGMCQCLDPYEPVPGNSDKCQCKNPYARGTENNGCTVTCPDPLMDSSNNCACPPGTQPDDPSNPQKCICANDPSLAAPDCACPDTHMDPADCTCKPPYKPDTSDPTKCECANNGDPDNNCELEYVFILCATDREQSVPSIRFTLDSLNAGDVGTQLGCYSAHAYVHSFNNCITPCPKTKGLGTGTGLVTAPGKLNTSGSSVSIGTGAFCAGGIDSWDYINATNPSRPEYPFLLPTFVDTNEPFNFSNPSSVSWEHFYLTNKSDANRLLSSFDCNCDSFDLPRYSYVWLFESKFESGTKKYHYLNRKPIKHPSCH